MGFTLLRPAAVFKKMAEYFRYLVRGYTVEPTTVALSLFSVGQCSYFNDGSSLLFYDTGKIRQCLGPAKIDTDTAEKRRQKPIL